MAEQHKTNADSFATLSEASFAEDWDSKEDRVYKSGLDLAEREARLEALLARRAHNPQASHSYETCKGCLVEQQLDYPSVYAAVAMRLARALRESGDEIEEIGWHVTGCPAAYDYIHYDVPVKKCEGRCAEAREIFADWERLLKGLGGG